MSFEVQSCRLSFAPSPYGCSQVSRLCFVLPLRPAHRWLFSLKNLAESRHYRDRQQSLAAGVRFSLTLLLTLLFGVMG